MELVKWCEWIQLPSSAVLIIFLNFLKIVAEGTKKTKPPSQKELLFWEKDGFGV